MLMDFAQPLRTLGGEVMRDDFGFAAYTKRLAEVCEEQDCDELTAESIIKRDQPDLHRHRLLTLGACAISALLGPDEAASGVEKMQRWLLAERIYPGGVQEVTAEEIGLIKARIGKCYNAVAVGPAYRLLESPGESANA